MQFCKNCCYCNFAEKSDCPFYNSNIENTDLQIIQKNMRRDKFTGTYLAKCLLQGHRTEADVRRAVGVLKKFARKKYAPAQYMLSLCYFDGVGVAQKDNVAFSLCEQAARQGCSLAEIRLCECYKNGIGVEKDFIKAKKWCEKAAYHSSKQVYYDFAVMCTCEQYGTTDIKKACEFFEKDLAEGNERAFGKLIELHKYHLEKCFTQQEPSETEKLAHFYSELGDFCLANKYAPNMQKAISYYKKALKEEIEEAKGCYGIVIATPKEKNAQNIATLNEKIQNCFEEYFATHSENISQNEYRQAIAGNAEAEFNLGMLFENKDFELRDKEEANKWYSLSAQHGYAKAQYVLGNSYLLGKDVGQNYEKAVKWLILAAEQGHAKAQADLGDCYYNGQGVKKDFTKAVKWYTASAQQGEAVAQAGLGDCYYYGNGIRESIEQAFKWYMQAAKQGYAKAQSDVGTCYYYGYGTKQNFEEAVKWFELGVEQNEPSAQIGLGVCYTEGQGVSQNHEEAVRLYRLAAKQDSAKAQFNLGVCYYYGQGVNQSYKEANDWFKLAAKQGMEEAVSAAEMCVEEIKKSAPNKSYSSGSSVGADTISHKTFGADQVSDYKTYLDKQLTGTLAPEERDEFDRRWG